MQSSEGHFQRRAREELEATKRPVTPAARDRWMRLPETSSASGCNRDRQTSCGPGTTGENKNSLRMLSRRTLASYRIKTAQETADLPATVEGVERKSEGLWLTVGKMKEERARR